MDDKLLELESRFEDAIKAMEERFSNIQTGRANPKILDPVMVKYYDVDTPLKQLAVVSIPEARQLMIKPFDKTSLSNIEKAIFEADLGLTPTNDGEVIRIQIPALTSDRRQEFVKQAKEMAEEARISIRNSRKDILNSLDDLDLSEDQEKRFEKLVQEKVDKANKKIEEVLENKEKELLEE